MDYEKAYKEALERARKLYKDAVTLQLEQDIKDYEYIFPELAESKDERIRKELIEHIKANCESDFILFQKFSPDDVIAWLEKQGKQKHTLRERYENIAQSEWFKRTHEGMSVSDEELKWSEEDGERLQSCISTLQGKGLMGGVDTINTKWLKSLKQRMEE